MTYPTLKKLTGFILRASAPPRDKFPFCVGWSDYRMKPQRSEKGQ